MKPARMHELIAALADCTATPGKGVTRLSYSEEDRQARKILTAELAAMGLIAWTDWAGNLHAALPGRNTALPTLVVGSHLDSVRNGGKYDGVVGVVGALAALQRIVKAGVRPERGIRFIAFAEEEGSNFSLPLMGSKAFAGKLRPEDVFALRDAAGRRAAEVFTAFGLADHTPPRELDARNCGFMLELHVEQGAQLEEAGAAIGLVDVVVASYTMTVELTGRAGHSGTTPMRGRRDALAGAAEMILFCERLAKGEEGGGAVMTVGHIRCEPNAFNCVPGKVAFTVDLRHPDPSTTERVRRAAEDGFSRLAGERGLSCRVTAKFTPGAAMSREIRDLTAAEAAKLGLDSRVVPSWAMHDAGALAGQLRAGIIFVPSRGGLSHHPDEYTSPEHIEGGIELLCAASRGIAFNADFPVPAS